MLTRSIVCSLMVMMATLAHPTPVATAHESSVHASRVTMIQPTVVCGYYLLGDYIVVHDDAKMARGEPCTTFYRLNSPERAEAAVSFHCIPRARDAVARTTITTRPATTATKVVELVEYQIAGDAEAHGVPGLPR